MQKRILTPEQVAQILQVHPFTVLKFIKQGRLKASKLGRVYRIRESDVEAFLDEASDSPKQVVKVVTDKKTKTKNKTSSIKSDQQKELIESDSKNISSAEKSIEQQDSTELTPSFEQKISEKNASEKITPRKVSVEMIEQDSPQNQNGGQDYYYIL